MSGRRREEPALALASHTVGNALVVHPEARMTEETQALAMSVALDTEHQMVIVDLPAGVPVSAWEQVVRLLPRHRRGVRLVLGGRPREATALTGQWLSERLGRTVVAPDGTIYRGAGGTLFVHSGKGSGWIRFRPGRTPEWEAKRFPRPSWDSGAIDPLPTSSVGIADPIPGGVWIHAAARDSETGGHWSRLVRGMPCQPDVFTVVLGCPGTPPLSLDDVSRFWRGLDPQLRNRVRFVQYGPVRVPEGEALGQALADLLESPVVCYAGMPVGSPSAPDIYTVCGDGGLGWQVFAREIGYLPRTHPEFQATPALLSHRAPVAGLEQVGPTAYWYTPDAVVEVVQSGLWIRPPQDAQNVDAVRAERWSVGTGILAYDDADEKRAERMQTLARDVMARLDPATRVRSRLVAASELGQAPILVTGPAEGALTPEEPVWAASETVRMSAVPAEVPALPAAEPVALPPAVAFEAPEPSWSAFSTTVPAVPAEPPAVAPEAPSSAVSSTTKMSAVPVKPDAAASAADLVEAPAPTEAAAPPKTVAGPPESGPVVPAPPVWGPPVSAPTVPAPTESPVVPAGPVPSAAPEVPAPEVPTDVVPPGLGAEKPAGPPESAPVSAMSIRLESPSVPGIDEPAVPQRPDLAPPVEPPAPNQTAAPEKTAASDNAVPSDSTGQQPRTSEAPEEAASDGADPRSQAGDGETRSAAAKKPAGPGLQPTPQPAASALVYGDDLTAERGWLRKTLSREFDAMAHSISRILSEHPGFQTSDGSSADVLADTVAVRLHLSAQGEAVDRALRTGGNGPHVPFARCVASGLRRLPSHRGATIFAATPTPEEWAIYQRRKLITEWGFVHALTEPSTDQQGEVDVLTWSMTARRTKLLEPGEAEQADNRVVFVPGTSFKILEMTEPADGARGRILLRELAASEVDESGRVEAREALDELAITSLQRCIERWGNAQPRGAVGEAARGRFGAMPGLT
ncbi:hypothetical protein AB0L13_40215 [Saccharopolyspora shandongensis]|uniref:hypothetical protein n=1 Tax=Saccharopolyspora shandongensis TaxID=418495 RepID=UPI0034437F2C